MTGPEVDETAPGTGIRAGDSPGPAPRILITVSRRWADRKAITDALRNTIDTWIKDGRHGPIQLIHALRADPIADELWRSWHKLRDDWFAAPVLWRTVEQLDPTDADMCLALIRNNSDVPTDVVKLAKAAGIPVRIVRRDTTGEQL